MKLVRGLQWAAILFMSAVLVVVVWAGLSTPKITGAEPSAKPASDVASADSWDSKRDTSATRKWLYGDKE